MNMKKIKDESGIALITALLIMILVTVLGTAAIMTSTTDVKIGENFKKSADAFYLAEAGLETGLAYLDSNFDADEGWNCFATDAYAADQSIVCPPLPGGYDQVIDDPTTEEIEPGTTVTNVMATSNTVGSGTFILYTRDDTDTSTTGDDNKRIYLRSVGTLSGTIASTTTVETYVEFDQPYESYGGKDLTAGNTNVAEGEATWSIN